MASESHAATAAGHAGHAGPASPADEAEGKHVPVQVVGTIGLMFGLAAVSCLPYALLPFVDGQWVIAPQRNTPADLWVLVSTLIELGLGLVLLLSSIGCYSREWWARAGMLLWAASSLVWGLVAAAFYWRWLIPAYRPMIGDVRDEAPWGALVFWIVAWVFSVFVLRYMTRPEVKAEFARGVRRAPVDY